MEQNAPKTISAATRRKVKKRLRIKAAFETAGAVAIGGAVLLVLMTGWYIQHAGLDF